MPRLVLAFLWSISLRAQTKHERLGAFASGGEETAGHGPEPQDRLGAGIFLRFYLSNNRTSVKIYCGGILWAMLLLSVIIELGIEC